MTNISSHDILNGGSSGGTTVNAKTSSTISAPSLNFINDGPMQLGGGAPDGLVELSETTCVRGPLKFEMMAAAPSTSAASLFAASSSSSSPLPPRRLVCPTPAPSPIRPTPRIELFYQDDARKKVSSSAKISYSDFDWDDIQKPSHAAHGVGLRNSSNDCFMNSILQFVLHTPPLLRVILSARDHACAELCMFCALQQHYRLMLKGQNGMSARAVARIVNANFPNRLAHNQEDAHEMLTFLLDKLEPPINAKKQKEQQKNGGKPSLLPPTEIDLIFGGKLKTQLQCQHCNAHRNYLENVRELNLSLPHLQNNDYVKLEHCIANHFRTETMIGYKCEKCGEAQTIRQWRIKEAPNILIVQLKRFRHNSTKIGTNVECPLALNLSKWCAKNEGHCAYRLFGFIDHFGSSIHSGHYTATMRGYDDKFYLFDDEIVRLANTANLIRSNCYILFYSKSNSPSAFLQR